MKPFFSYYGSKWRLAAKYGHPQFDTVIEPFAGSACYSVYHNAKRAILYDVDPTIIELWQYLIAATPAEIRALPLEFDVVPEDLPKGAQHLLGFLIAKGHAFPAKRWSSWGTSYREKAGCFVWGPAYRERIAHQVNLIKGWQAHLASYEEIPDTEATWFVDPPYQEKGYKYRHSDIDYVRLAEWVKARQGQVIVCEQSGADWLPFEPLASVRTLRTKKKTFEVCIQFTNSVPAGYLFAPTGAADGASDGWNYTNPQL